MMVKEYYCSNEEATIGKMFMQTGDKSPSKFIHSSPEKKNKDLQLSTTHDVN